MLRAVRPRKENPISVLWEMAQEKVGLFQRPLGASSS